MPELRDQDVERLLERAVLVHLTEEDLGRYHDGAVNETARARIAAHLRRCLICSRQYETMQHILATYHEAGVLPETREQMRALAELRIIVGLVLLARVRRFGALAAGQGEIQDGQTEDGALRWRIVDDESGDLIIRLGSHRLELEGFKVALRAGPMTKEVTLQRLAKDQVGAQLLIAREEREALPDDVELIIDDLTPPEDARL